MKRNITIAVIAVFVIGAVWILAAHKGTVDPANTRMPMGGRQPSATSTPATSTDKAYTLADVAKHTTQSSCWTTIDGNVYDLTAWISQHPGGAAAILSLCGKDGSAAFNAQHGGQARPAAELASFLIGTLTK
jgi:cytochrome b involved in lipid metabolism